MTPDMIKLILILGIGAIAGIGGQIYIIKKKHAKSNSNEQLYSSNVQNESPQQTSSEEETARNYINQYKNQYPQESIKQGLINTGISQEAAQNYINKYL